MRGAVVMFECLIYEKVGRVAKITLNRPEVYNAINEQAKREIAQALHKAQDDASIGCVLLTGAGEKAFCSGQDLSESVKYDPNDVEHWMKSFQDLYNPLRDFDKPLVCAINGVSVGSGFQVPLLCDIRLASSTARFAMTEIDVGLACIMGANLLCEAMGECIATYMILSGEFISAQRMKEIGVITEIYEPDELQDKAMKFCQKMAEKPPVAIKMNKQFFRRRTEHFYRDSLDFAVVAHTEGYKSGEPNEYQKRFFARKKKK